MSRLVDEIERLDLPDRTKLLISICPGALFGFVPPNFKGLEERVDCEYCLDIAKRIKLILVKIEAHKKESESKKRFWHGLPIVSRFAPKEDNGLNEQIKEVLQEIKEIENRDNRHWVEQNDRETSREFVSCYVGRENWESYSPSLAS